MIKILQVVGTLDVGGIEKWVANFINYCNKKVDNELDLYILSLDKDKKAILEQINIRRDKVYFVKSNNLTSRLFSLYKTIKEINPDFIHLHPGYSTGIYSCFIKLTSKSKVMIHSHSDRRIVEKDCGYKRKKYIYITKYLISKFSDYRLAVSEKAGQSLFINGFTIKNCGVPSLDFNPDYINPKLEGLKEKKKIFHIGRYSEAKNYPFLIELCLKFKNHPDYQFIFIGANLDKYKLELMKEGVTNAVFLGFQKNPEQIVRKYASLFIMPSLWEGLPLSAVEAQKSGVFCLLSDNITKECNIGGAKYIPLNVSLWEENIRKLSNKNQIDFSCRDDFTLSNDYFFYVRLLSNDS
ncbi:glycosyltransferase [Aliivibrio fischeri]|uniref:glycosyltransferase n=1 Tax=Aliivibrio fischeri TaxID=668 RepID=UPI00080E0586|nr:glycosyltransferase [Aliivibrio fischeri]OCH36706.1 hypothetical protein A6E02_18875 [Aliivibrio fischeri]